MTEDDARAWVRERFGVSRETRLANYVDLLRTEAAAQNLIAPSTLDQIWSRHIVDSAQLLAHADREGGWLDIGSGAGLPGLVIAILRDDAIDLVEPRKLRTAFLARVVDQLDLPNVSISNAKVERTTGIVSAITARAVASVDQLFRIARHRADLSTIWLLPKGRSAHSELEEAQRSWQGWFHVEQSVTAEDSLIIVARGVRPK